MCTIIYKNKNREIVFWDEQPGYKGKGIHYHLSPLLRRLFVFFGLLVEAEYRIIDEELL
jgi:hypothetical protein